MSVIHLTNAFTKLVMLSGSPIQNTINDLGVMLKMIASDIFADFDIISKYKLRTGSPKIA